MASTASSAPPSTNAGSNVVMGYPISLNRHVVGGYLQNLPPSPPQPANPPVSFSGILQNIIDFHQRNRRFFNLLFAIITLAIGLLFILSCIFLLIRLLFKPRPLSIAATWATLHPPPSVAAVAQPSDKALPISGCDVSLAVENPNRGVDFLNDHFEVSLFYSPNHWLISQAQVGPFELGKKSKKVVEANFNLSTSDLKNEVLEALRKDINNGSVSFDLEIASMVKFAGTDENKTGYLLKSLCDGLNFNRTGNLVNPYTYCTMAE